MGVFDKYKNLIHPRHPEPTPLGPEYEYCPRCYANLTMQKGYDSRLPYWICEGCGEMLINPELDCDSDIVWICDECGALLNIQPGFNEGCDEWKCSECGFVNRIDDSEVYTSEEAFRIAQSDPYRGLPDKDVLELSYYQEDGIVDKRPDIIFVHHKETGKRYVKKLLTAYNKTIYEYLKDNPVSHMPRVEAVYEGSNCLIAIEEYIEGTTLEKMLDGRVLPEEQAVDIIRKVCIILDDLHSRTTPIIHRDVKPSNIMIAPGGEVYLLDMNVAKWFDPDETDDTRYMGTQHYAAPEQVGYGMTASSGRTDIYAVGITLNVMLTGRFPKEKHPEGGIWEIIEKCISLKPEDRYDAKELVSALDALNGDE